MSILRKRWMDNLNDKNVKVSELTIPGTHDTGTWPKHLDLASVCQDWDLKRQLESGIRFIDIRLVPTHNNSTQQMDLVVWHGDPGTNEGLWFSTDILGVCKTFLETNPSETIIMSIKNEHKFTPVQFTDALAPYLQSAVNARTNEPLFYTGAVVPKLADVQGQIVLFRRYAGRTDNGAPPLAGEIGINAYDGWPDDQDATGPTPSGLMIQDVYGFAINDQIKKWAKVENFLTQTMAYTMPDRWWINFTSASGGMIPRDFAKVVNPKLSMWLSEYLHGPSGLPGVGRLGLIVMDFPDETIIDMLIQTNQLKDQSAIITNKYCRIQLLNKDNNDPGYIGKAHYDGGNRWNYAQVYDGASTKNYLHALVKLGFSTDPVIYSGDVVHIMTNQFTNDIYIYLAGNDDGINCLYDQKDNPYYGDDDIIWIVEHSPVDKNGYVGGEIAEGNPVRFRHKKTGKYLCAAKEDHYLNALDPSDYPASKAYKNPFDWVLYESK